MVSRYRRDQKSYRKYNPMPIDFNIKMEWKYLEKHKL